MENMDYELEVQVKAEIDILVYLCRATMEIEFILAQITTNKEFYDVIRSKHNKTIESLLAKIHRIDNNFGTLLEGALIVYMDNFKNPDRFGNLRHQDIKTFEEVVEASCEVISSSLEERLIHIEELKEALNLANISSKKEEIISELTSEIMHTNELFEIALVKYPGNVVEELNHYMSKVNSRR